MTRDYELTVLLAPTLSEKDLDKEVAKIQALVTKGGGKAKGKDPKKRALAYEIRKVREAYEAYFDVSMPADTLGQIEPGLRLMDSVIRYLLVKKAE
jgi:small subunit ribosomal protein S6